MFLIDFFTRFIPGLRTPSFHEVVRERKDFIDALRRGTPAFLKKNLKHITDRKFMDELMRRLYCYSSHAIKYQTRWVSRTSTGCLITNKNFGLEFNEIEIRFWINNDFKLADYDYETTVREILSTLLEPYGLIVTDQNVITPDNESDKELATYCRKTWD